MKHFIYFLVLIYSSISFAQGLPEEFLEELNVTESSSSVNYNISAKVSDIDVVESYLNEDGNVYVSGTYTLVNKSDIPTQAFHHVVYGGLKGDGYLLQYPDFDVLRGDSIILNANETRVYDFSLVLDDMTRYGDMGVEVKLERVYGSNIHKFTERIEVDGTRDYDRLDTVYDDTQSFFTINREDYPIVFGPTVYEKEDTLLLKVVFPEVPFSTIVNTDVSIYEETYFSESVREIDGGSVVLGTEDSTEISFRLPRSLTPGVYPIKIEFKDSKDRLYFPNLYGRYIIGGPITGVVGMDIHGDNLITGFTADISGLPPDIVNPERRSIQNLEMRSLVFNTNTDIVDEQTISFRVGNFTKVKVDLPEALNKEEVQKVYIEILSNGEVVDTYEQFINNPPKDYSKEIYIALGGLLTLILLTLIIKFMNRGKGKDGSMLVGLLILFSLFVSGGEVEAVEFSDSVTLYEFNPNSRDTDLYNYEDFITDSGMAVTINGPLLNSCVVPGQIIPINIDVSYALCGNVAHMVGKDEDDPGNEYTAVKFSVYVADDWFDDRQIEWYETNGDVVVKTFDEAKNFIDIAESYNHDIVEGQESRDANDDAMWAMGDIENALPNSYVELETQHISSTNGTGNIDLSLIAPERSGIYRVYFKINTQHKFGASYNISYIDVEVCGKHDACALMDGDQYVDDSGVLRNEDGSELEGYDVQILQDAYVEGGGNSQVFDANADFSFLSVCNYCPQREDAPSSSGYVPIDTVYYDVDRSWIDKMLDFGDFGDFGWVNMYDNFGVSNPNNEQVKAYFTMAQYNRKDVRTAFSEIPSHEEYTTTFGNLAKLGRRSLDYFSGVTKYDNFIVHKEGEDFMFLSTNSLGTSLGYSNSTGVDRDLNLPKYSFENVISDADIADIFDINMAFIANSQYVHNNDTDQTDTYIFKENDSNESGSIQTQCMIYEDYCTTVPGIQFTIYDEVSDNVELYQREDNGDKTYLYSLPSSLATEQTLCQIPENACPKIPFHTFDPDTKEVFDENDILDSSYVYTPSDGQCRSVCSNLSTHTYINNDTVYDESGNITDHEVINDDLCVLACPNYSGATYNESNNSVYGWSDNLDTSLEYDPISNTCRAGDACVNIDGYQTLVDYSYPPLAEDSLGMYEIDESTGMCSPFSCPGGETYDEYWGSCIPSCADGENYDYYYGQCISCPDGETYDEYWGYCVDTNCPDGEIFDSYYGYCVDTTCQDGEVYDLAYGYCVPDPCLDGETYDIESGTCNPGVPQCDDSVDPDVTPDGYCSNAYWYCDGTDEWTVDDSLCDTVDLCINSDFPGTQSTLPANVDPSSEPNCTCIAGYYADGNSNCIDGNSCPLLPSNTPAAVVNIFDKDGVFRMTDPTGGNDPQGVFDDYFKDMFTTMPLPIVYDEPSNSISGNSEAILGYITGSSGGICDVSICPSVSSPYDIVINGTSISSNCYNTSLTPENDVQLRASPNLIPQGGVCNIIWTAQGSYAQYCELRIDGVLKGTGMAGVLVEPMQSSSKEIEIICSDGTGNADNIVVDFDVCNISPDFNDF